MRIYIYTEIGSELILVRINILFLLYIKRKSHLLYTYKFYDLILLHIINAKNSSQLFLDVIYIHIYMRERFTIEKFEAAIIGAIPYTITKA